MNPTIDPGEGYRLLIEGETIQKEDEYLTEKCWQTVLSYGLKYPGSIKSLFCRRKIHPSSVNTNRNSHEMFVVTNMQDNPLFSSCYSLSEAKEKAQILANANPGKFYVFQAITAYERPAQPEAKEVSL